jgi:hypothetical protein
MRLPQLSLQSTRKKIVDINIHSGRGKCVAKKLRTIPLHTLCNSVQPPSCPPKSTLRSLEVGVEFLK